MKSSQKRQRKRSTLFNSPEMADYVKGLVIIGLHFLSTTSTYLPRPNVLLLKLPKLPLPVSRYVIHDNGNFNIQCCFQTSFSLYVFLSPIDVIQE